MRWSWRIGQVAGIGIYLHGTFLILLVWLGLSEFLRGQSVTQAASGLAFIITLFGIIVLHELGHALTARRFGIRTRDIILLPIGGVARLERMPEDPKQELLVALAGPAVNLVLAAGLTAALVPVVGFAVLSDVAFVGGRLLVKLVWVNIALAVFNLLPAFPMDGGRVLRALLAIKMDYVHATQIAAYIGQGMALLFGFAGLFANPFLLFIALFVWMGAAEESAMVQMKSAFAGIPISKAMITQFHTLSPQDTLGHAVDYILAGFQHDFPVLEEGRLVGVLPRADLMTAFAKQGPGGRVAEAMRHEFETADPSEMLESAFARLRACECHTLPVVRGGYLVGMVTMDNLGEFMMVQSAIRDLRT